MGLAKFIRRLSISFHSNRTHKENAYNVEIDNVNASKSTQEQKNEQLYSSSEAKKEDHKKKKRTHKSDGKKKDKSSKSKKSSKRGELSERPKRKKRTSKHVEDENICDNEYAVEEDDIGARRQVDILEEPMGAISWSSSYSSSQQEDDDPNNEDDDSGDNFLGDSEFGIQELSKKPLVTCLSPDQIVNEQEIEIKKVADILSIPISSASYLLRHFNWNREVLLTKYFEDPSKVLEEAGIDDQCDDIAVSIAVPLSGQEMCSICAEETSADEATALSCQHRFCNSCWRDYLTMKIQEGESTSLHCPHFKCNLRVDDSIVKKLVEPEVYDKFIRFVIKSFVEDNGSIKWCPTPDCGNAIAADLIVGITDVRCVCGYRFCFSCHREAHSPAFCEHMKRWEEKCRDDSETLNWVNANTKICPGKCDSAIEKNGGCNHMICRQCKYEWCWVCMRSWKGHNDYYTCNRYEKKERSSKKKSKKKHADDREQFKQALERYLHFYERYLNHNNSRKLEQSMREKALSKMKHLEREMTRVEVQYIEEATEQLLVCRNVLKYSYVVAYFLNDGVSRHLFEILQENLEKITERLSELLESDCPDRLDTVNITQLAQTRKDAIIDFSQELTVVHFREDLLTNPGNVK